MTGAFEKALDHTLDLEGGYANDPADPGGATRFGITESVARNHGYNGPMDELPLEIAKEIYRASYWDKMLLDRVTAIAGEEVAVELFDTGVNMGIGTAGKFLQRSLNVFNKGGTIYDDIAVDGVIGPQTLEALTAYIGERGQEGREVLFKAINGLQTARYIDLADMAETNERFVYGWIRQRT